MRRLLVVGLVSVLVAGALALPAAAQKKRAKPVASTLYFEGTETVGETESMAIVADGYLGLSPDEPGDGTAKSKGLLNYVRGPNHDCAGNSLWPVYVGKLNGKVTGEMKVIFHSVSTPGEVVVRVWPDVMSQMCTNEALGAFDYPEPAAELRLPVPAGQGEIEAVFEKVNFTATASLMVQISPAKESTPAGSVFPPLVGRVLYGSSSAPSRVEFKCVPRSGKTCI
jgi:hypothetical protein